MKFTLKSSLLLSILIAGLLLSGCKKTSTSVTLPLDGSKEGVITNADFELTIEAIEKLEFVKLGDKKVSVKESLKDTYGLYQLRATYVNLTNSAKGLYYKNIIVTVPDIEDTAEIIQFVGFCVQEQDKPLGSANRCAAVPSQPAPGVYGVQGVYMMNTYIPEPGEKADFYIYVIVDTSQPSLEISFTPTE